MCHVEIVFNNNYINSSSIIYYKEWLEITNWIFFKKIMTMLMLDVGIYVNACTIYNILKCCQLCAQLCKIIENINLFFATKEFFITESNLYIQD